MKELRRPARHVLLLENLIKIRVAGLERDEYTTPTPTQLRHHRCKVRRKVFYDYYVPLSRIRSQKSAGKRVGPVEHGWEWERC